MPNKNSFGAASTLRVNNRDYQVFRLSAVEQAGTGKIARLPYSIKVLLENLLRSEDGLAVKRSDIEYVTHWDTAAAPREIQFSPARVLLQDFTGVPCVVDLAAMRDALKSMGADPSRANPLIPADLVIDHSVQVDAFGTPDASKTPFSSSNATRSAIPSYAGASRLSPTSASSLPTLASFTK
jgi:aconitate hydratase